MNTESNIKMRVLYASGKKKMAGYAAAIAEKYGLASNRVDVIPPAYSCDKERIVFIGATVSDEPDDSLRRFCSELGKIKAANVALFIDGKEKGANAVKNILAEAGTNVCGDILYVKGGIPFLGKINDEEKKTILDWAEKIMAKLV